MSDIGLQLERLKSPNRNMRREACEELGVAEVLPQQAFTALELAASDQDALVADAARRALLTHRMPLSRSEAEAEIPTARSTESGYMPIAASFGLAIVLNALAILVVDNVVWGGELANVYLVLCLPVSVVILAFGAGVGALLAKCFGGSPRIGATIGIWIGAVPSIALSLWALLRVGPGV